MRWFAVVLAGCLAVTAWARTIPLDDAPAMSHGDDLHYSLNSVSTRLLRADAAYREFAVADSVLRLLPDTAGFAVSLPGTARAPDVDVLTDALTAELASIPRPRARVGVFLINDAFARHEGVPLRVSHGDRELYAGSDDAGPYCALVGKSRTHEEGRASVDAFTFARRSGVHGVMGPCRFYALYGAPGPAIDRWLSAGAYAIAESPGPVPLAWDRRDLNRARLLWTGGDLRIRACAGGRLDDGCGEILTMPGAIPEVLLTGMLPGPGASRLRLSLPQGAATFNMPPMFGSDMRPFRLMLSRIEAEFGEERFARFWASDREVPAAFAAAFGMDIDAWVQDWSRSTYGELRLAATAPAPTILLSCLAALILGGLGAAVASRRTV